MGAVADGLFAEQNLQVELTDPEPGRGPDNVLRVANGDPDFCLTSVHHYLSAREKAGEPIAARFVVVIVQWSPVAALVRQGSPVQQLSDLSGARVGASPDPSHTAEFVHTMIQYGHRPPADVVDAEAGRRGLPTGEVDAVVGFIDALPRLRRLIGTSLRPIPLGLPVYASGLVAGDHVSAAKVERMRTALVKALYAQRSNPGAALSELLHRNPDLRRDEALEGWRLIEPYIFTVEEPGTMAQARWVKTLRFLSDARQLAPLDPETVYRTELTPEGPLAQPHGAN